MNVTLLTHTPDVEKTIALAAKLCYSDSNIGALEERLGNESQDKFIKKILDLGHLSVLEHASFTFGIEGISRATSHQLVRHRLASYSQQSQRYVKMQEDAEFVVPPSVLAKPEIEKKFREAARLSYKVYEELTKAGVPKEDARYLLPNAAETKIIMTMNARELLHFFELRCCERAQWEIREMATIMVKLVKKVATSIFDDAGPGCVSGPCLEGDMTCGKPKEIRKKFREL
ncbi:MAG: FAD-dependent thymidylate synthase [Deltaproteobacteria bacterium]|nr:FAD-dependent thymidylate synthase [Deltaproteobacteria bacterium]